jgi:hypothetical protein
MTNLIVSNKLQKYLIRFLLIRIVSPRSRRCIYQVPAFFLHAMPCHARLPHTDAHSQTDRLQTLHFVCKIFPSVYVSIPAFSYEAHYYISLRK